MRLPQRSSPTLLLGFCWIVTGCQSATDPITPQAETAAESVARDSQVSPPSVPAAPQTSTGSQDWKLYTPPEGDFSVMVPADPIESSRQALKPWTVRRYLFTKGDTPMVVEIYSDRTGELASNTVDDLRDSPDIVPGTLREVSLPGMPGIEFRTKGRIGEVVFREFCSPDRSQSISLSVQKDVGGMSEAEVRTFLDSFKLLPEATPSALRGR